jgi:hypothetical protein
MKEKLSEPEATRGGFSEIEPYFDAIRKYFPLQLELYNSPDQEKKSTGG